MNFESPQCRLQNEILVLEGVIATLFQSHFQSGSCLELANIERPDLVRGPNSACLDAKADPISTNTLGLNRVQLKAYGLDAAIVNPGEPRIMETLMDASMPRVRDRDSQEFVRAHVHSRNASVASGSSGQNANGRHGIRSRLAGAVADGNRAGAEALLRKAVASGISARGINDSVRGPAIRGAENAMNGGRFSFRKGSSRPKPCSIAIGSSNPISTRRERRMGARSCFVQPGVTCTASERTSSRPSPMNMPCPSARMDSLGTGGPRRTWSNR